MKSEWIAYALYSLPVILIIVVQLVRMGRHKRNVKKLKDVQSSGMGEPASLHPIIDPALCMGCGACVSACPEGEILGLIHGKAKLINPTYCIGHGACKASCPFHAIELVFGSESRGVDIPNVRENFETNISGIFIAGELGGMGLIRNAAEQGRQAIENISKLKGIGSGQGVDVVIVGAGPAGFSATLAAKEKNLRYVTVEQDSLGGCVFKYPRGKVVMTAPVKLALVGKVKLRETTKEALLSMWKAIESKTRIKINYNEKMDDIKPEGTGYVVTTSKNKYHTRAVLLAIGRRGTPRKLGVPGEDQEKVVYSLIDAEQYRGQHVLVVGGGDSALEAALSIADEPNTKVTLSYRSEAFSRVKDKNLKRVQESEKQGKLKVLLSSNVKNILADKVVIEQQGKSIELKNNGVIVCAGGVLPTPFLKQIGIEVETKYGTA